MAEVVMIPIIAAIVNGIAHAIDHRFRTLPVTPDRVLAVLS
jgi:CO/xanthine dehydrogenase Mo-binding subunit